MTKNARRRRKRRDRRAVARAKRRAVRRDLWRRWFTDPLSAAARPQGVIVHTTGAPMRASDVAEYWRTPPLGRVNEVEIDAAGNVTARLVETHSYGVTMFVASDDVRPGDLVTVRRDGTVGRAENLPAVTIGRVSRVVVDEQRRVADVVRMPDGAWHAEPGLPAFIDALLRTTCACAATSSICALCERTIKRSKGRRILSDSIDELLHDLGGPRMITGVLDIKSHRHDFAPTDGDRNGALLVKIDDVVYRFSNGYDDPLHVAKERQRWLASQTARRIEIDGVRGPSTEEALKDLELPWEDVPMLNDSERYLVVDVAEGDDAEMIDAVEEVHPGVMVEVRGRCSCSPRVDGCVDELYATDEATGLVVLEVGLTTLTVLESRPVFVKNFAREGVSPQPWWLEFRDDPIAEVPVKCASSSCGHAGMLLASRSKWDCPRCGFDNAREDTEVLDPDSNVVLAMQVDFDALIKYGNMSEVDAIKELRRRANVEDKGWRLHRRVDALERRLERRRRAS